MTWRPAPLKRWLVLNDSGVWGDDPLDDDAATPVVRSTDIRMDGSWDLADVALRRLTASERTKARLRVGDLVVVTASGSADHLGKTAIVDEKVGSTGAAFSNFVQRLRPGPNADPRYLRYVLSSASGKADLARLGTTSTGLRNLSGSLLGSVACPGPSAETQRRIADYLDAETSRIDALISAKQKMIAAASARYRATVVSDLASTRSAPLKRSALLVDCKHRTATYVAEGYPVVSPGDVTAGELDLSRCHRFVTRADWLDLADGPREPRVGDIVYSRNASIGLAALVTTDEAFCMGQDVCLVRPQRRDGDGRFLTHVLNTVGLDQIDRLKVGSTFFRVNVAQIAELQIPVADESDQDQLVLRWDDELGWYQRLLTTLSRQIGLLKERRQALITAVVSGELAV